MVVGVSFLYYKKKKKWPFRRAEREGGRKQGGAKPLLLSFSFPTGTYAAFMQLYAAF